MSTVMGGIEAVHCGLDVLEFSAIMNINDPDDYKGTSLEYIVPIAEEACPQIVLIFRDVLNQIMRGNISRK
jgi:hypothetical protein